MTMVPRGQVDIAQRAHGLDVIVGDRWPEGLRLCAVRRADGARVVFGREGSPVARVADAVLASCAIPGYFKPITIAGREYVDGGVHSITNADVLRGESLDTVIVVSSLSASQGTAYGADGLIRRRIHRRMEHEVARLEAEGTAVIRLEPGPESRHVMGLRAMAEDRGPRVIEAAYEETRLCIRSTPFLADLGQPIRVDAAAV
jgi:NTE family protein